MKLLPNPAVFSVNEVVFAITSVDVLFHLQSQQFFKPCLDPVDTASDDSLLDPNAKDALSRGCRHILRQRRSVFAFAFSRIELMSLGGSFYPLFPAPHGNGIDPLNLDVTHNDLVKLSDDGPDIVILPSILKHFAKVSPLPFSLDTIDTTLMLCGLGRRFNGDCESVIPHSRFIRRNLRSNDDSPAPAHGTRKKDQRRSNRRRRGSGRSRRTDRTSIIRTMSSRFDQSLRSVRAEEACCIASLVRSTLWARRAGAVDSRSEIKRSPGWRKGLRRQPTAGCVLVRYSSVAALSTPLHSSRQSL